MPMIYFDQFFKKQVEIRSNRSRLCGLGNREFLRVNIKNEFLKSFIIKRDKVINIMIWEAELSGKISYALLNEFI